MKTKPFLACLFLSVFNLLRSPVPVQAASFDCGKATSPTEKKICADTNLSKADTDLMNVYKQAISVAPDRKTLKEGQKAWLKSRDTCPDSACIQKAYQERISELQKMVSDHPA